jgi:hypothetical protein
MCIMYFQTYARAFVGFDIISSCLMHSRGSFAINIHIIGKESRANTEKPGIPNTTTCSRTRDGLSKWYASGRGEVHTEF